MARPKKEDFVATQIRIPRQFHTYMSAESERMHISTNAVLNILLENGIKYWESFKNTDPKEILKEG